jgi:hypothetical protein
VSNPASPWRTESEPKTFVMGSADAADEVDTGGSPDGRFRLCPAVVVPVEGTEIVGEG